MHNKQAHLLSELTNIYFVKFINIVVLTNTALIMLSIRYNYMKYAMCLIFIFACQQSINRCFIAFTYIQTRLTERVLFE